MGERYAALTWRGGATVARHALNVELLVRIQTPQPKRACTPLFDVVKGGGEVNKRYKCFAALLAALVSSFCFCLPCFASNNAATFEWVVTASKQMYGENGQLTDYLQLSPFVDGNFYAATFETRFLSYRGSYYVGPHTDSPTYDTAPQVWGCPVNYPDWWRADLPLGRNSYVQFDKLTFIPSGSSSLFSDLTSVSFLPQNKVYSFDITADQVVEKQKYPDPDVHLSGKFPFYLIYTYSQATNNDVNDSFVGADLLCLTGKPVSYNATSPVIYTMSEDQCVLTLNQNNLHYSYYWIDSMSNASLSQIEWLVMPDISNWSDEQKLQLNNKILKVSAEVSFWIDANKLPAGLEVGDSFPAPDQFDSLRDGLLDKYDVKKQIEDTDSYLDEAINGFPSIDSDVASGASCLLSGLFQNLDTFLFSVILFCLGAVFLRIVLRKAVD